VADHRRPADVEAAHAAIPGSRLEIFEGAGHFPHAEYPERFAEVVTEFIDSTRPASRNAGEDRSVIPLPPPAP